MDFATSPFTPPASKYFPSFVAWGGSQGLPQLFSERILAWFESCPRKKQIDVFYAFDKIVSSDYPPVSEYFPLILAWGGPQGLPRLLPKRTLMWLENCSTKHFFENFADFFACGSSFGPSWPSRWAQDGPGDPKGSQLGQDIGFGYPLGCRL